MSSNIEVTRICEHCKKQFTARTTRTRYCSHICNNRGYKALARKEKVEKSNTEFPRFDNCYTITEIQEKYNISSGALYLLIQRKGIVKYSAGRFTGVAKQDIDIIFNAGKR